jgi:hypothetical protein
METAAPPAAPRLRWLAILVAILFALVAIFFIAVSVSLAGDELCEDVIQQARESGQITVDECTDKSAANRTATVIVGALAGLAALWTVVTAIGVARARRTWGAVATAAIVTIVLAAATIIL